MIGTDAATSLIILSGAIMFTAGILIGQDIGRNESAIASWLRARIESPTDGEF